MSRPSKHFVLKNIDPAVIDEKYHFSIDFNLDRKEPPANCTRIDQMPILEPVDSSATAIFENADPSPRLHESPRRPIPQTATSTASTTIDAPGMKMIHGGLSKIPLSTPIDAETASSLKNIMLNTAGASTPATAMSASSSFWCGIHPKDTFTVTYLDECKKEHECLATLLRRGSEENPLPDQTLLHCFWCRHPFPHRPIGIPLVYVPHRLHKQYHSEITQDSYILRENVDRALHKIMSPAVHTESTPSPRKHATAVVPQYRDYYITDGIYCSFNCALAYIRDHRHDPLYRTSEMLLRKIYHEVYGTDASTVEPSPSWRLLMNYGGHLTIEDYRRNLFKVDYRATGSVVLPSFRPIGFLFEKQIRI